jgi:hypothetical protein
MTDAHLDAFLRERFGNVRSLERYLTSADASALGFQKTADRFQRGAFSRSVRTQKCDHLALWNLNRNTFDRQHYIVVQHLDTVHGQNVLGFNFFLHRHSPIS